MTMTLDGPAESCLEDVMEIRYNLDENEVKKITFQVRFISNRKSRSQFIDAHGQKWIEPFISAGRRDMFWVNCYLEGIDLGPVSIEPSFSDPERFWVDRNWSKVGVGYNEMRERIEKWFKTTPQYKKQVKWAEQLAINIKMDKKAGFTEPMKAKN